MSKSKPSDIQISTVGFYNLPGRRLTHWIKFTVQDPKQQPAFVRKDRKRLVKYIESFLGPEDQRWSLMTKQWPYIIRLDSKDAVFWTLRFPLINIHS